MQLLMRLQHVYEQIKYVPRTTDLENLRDTKTIAKRQQNDNKNISKINPRTSFKHQRPLITPPWRSDPKTQDKIRFEMWLYSKFAPRSAVAAKVSIIIIVEWKLSK